MKITFSMLLLVFSCQIVLSQDTSWAFTDKGNCKFLDPFPIDSARYEWSGTCKNQKINGSGTLKKWVGETLISTYEGEMKDGFLHGNGKMTFTAGIVYQGDFVWGELSGNGKQIYDESGTYEGELINYKRHGKGLYKSKSGATLSGIFNINEFYTGVMKDEKDKEYFYEKGKLVEKAPIITSSSYVPELKKELREYLDENHYISNKEKASFYRLITYNAPNEPKGIIKEFELDGTLLHSYELSYLSYDDLERNFYKSFTSYYPNGNIKYNLSYKRGEFHGKNIEYYESGEKERLKTYKNGKLEGLYMRWNPSGEISQYAYYEEGSLYKDRYIEFNDDGTGEVIINANFEKKKSDWVIENEEVQSEITSAGSIIYKLKDQESLAAPYQYVDFEKGCDFRIKMKMERRSGKGVGYYGIIYGYKDGDNFNQFVISTKGYYFVYSVYKGIKNYIQPLVESKKIKSGNELNELSIHKIDNELLFAINGEYVYKTQAPSISSNQFGCYIRGAGEFELSNMEFIEVMKESAVTDLKAYLSEQFSESNDWTASGSGFFISESGLIATNYHVIEDGSEILIEVTDEKGSNQYPGKVVATDPANDLAIIQIDKTGFSTSGKIPYAFTSQSQDVGTSVFTLGYPQLDVMGKEVKYNKGEISSKTGAKGDVTKYQISVPIQPGNSGGPLFDEKGNLVGIVCSRLNSKYEAENVNYAIKSAYLKSLIESLTENVVLKNTSTLGGLSTTTRIKALTPFIPIILVR